MANTPRVATLLSTCERSHENLGRLEAGFLGVYVPGMLTIAIGLLLFVLAACADYLDTRYTQAVVGRRVGRAIGCSVGMWLVSVAGLVAVVEVGWEVLPFEVCGLAVGTWLAMRE